MYIKRIFIRNFRNFAELDVEIPNGVTCIIGENNTGKTNFVHALRLALDANLSSYYRQLTEHDFHAGLSINEPQQVIVSVEFTDYEERKHECALVGCWEVDDNLARISFRYRPNQPVRDSLEAGDRSNDLDLEDYHWELTGGGDCDPSEVTWNGDLGTSVRFSDLQAFQVVTLTALRDVEQDLRRSRVSPLERILNVINIPEEEKNSIVEILREANQSIASSATVSQAGESIHGAFAATAGDAFPMDIKVGMADASFSAIARSLTLLMSNDVLKDFAPSRNGLGLNNILYVSMLIHYFEKRVAAPTTAGQLLIVEEPEAHLHPQLQRTLYGVLNSKPFQTIVTSHSTHISSLAPLSSYVVLTNSGASESQASRPVKADNLTDKDKSDLERYLDATRSTLLFARKVILVEGPAELFLIPPLVKHIMGKDLDRAGISLVPIYGVHFDVYSKLFGENAMPKKCAIIADGDLSPSDVQNNSDDFEDELPATPNFTEIESTYVKVFQCRTTFERALTLPGTLAMLSNAARDCGFTRTEKKLSDGHALITLGKLDGVSHKEHLNTLSGIVLAASRRAGKARFAQIASMHVELASELPKYIKNAVNWLLDDNAPNT